jgi:hypothetical protein
MAVRIGTMGCKEQGYNLSLWVQGVSRCNVRMPKFVLWFGIGIHAVPMDVHCVRVPFLSI